MLEEPTLIQRSSNSDDNYRTLKPDSSFVFPTKGASMAELLAFGNNQVRFTNMMIDLMGSLSGTKYLLIRGFVADENDQDEADRVREKLGVVKSLFKNPSQISQNHSGAGELAEFGAKLGSMVSSTFGGGSVTTMATGPLRLPNNSPVVPIQETKIIEQLSYLKKREDGASPVGEIRCMDRKLLGAIYKDVTVSESVSAGIFPKGGPSQSSWLDFRDDILGFNWGIGQQNPSINIIEVGIVDIPNSILSAKVQG